MLTYPPRDEKLLSASDVFHTSRVILPFYINILCLLLNPFMFKSSLEIVVWALDTFYNNLNIKHCSINYLNEI